MSPIPAFLVIVLIVYFFMRSIIILFYQKYFFKTYLEKEKKIKETCLKLNPYYASISGIDQQTWYVRQLHENRALGI